MTLEQTAQQVVPAAAQQRVCPQVAHAHQCNRATHVGPQLPGSCMHVPQLPSDYYGSKPAVARLQRLQRGWEGPGTTAAGDAALICRLIPSSSAHSAASFCQRTPQQTSLASWACERPKPCMWLLCQASSGSPGLLLCLCPALINLDALRSAQLPVCWSNGQTNV